MITKPEAAAATTQYIAAMPLRVNNFLLALAQSGTVGGVFSYTIEPQTLGDRIVTALTALGWTAVNDFVAKTITIS